MADAGEQVENYFTVDGGSDGDGEIPEATPMPLHPTKSKITNDAHEDHLPVTEEEIDALESDDSVLYDGDASVKVSGPKESHDLRALAIARNTMSGRNFCSVDVVGPDGVKKRFAPGTKAAFAVERFNCQLRDPAMPVVCIVACKDGEDPIEFGPDVELVVYDESWTLKTLREAVQFVNGKTVNDDPVRKVKDTIKEGTARTLSSIKPVTKVPGAIFGPESTNTKHNESNKSTRKSVEDMDPLQYFGVKNWEDLYPGGKLPEGGIQDCSPSYIGKVILMFILVFAFAGGLSYMLERLPNSTRPFF